MATVDAMRIANKEMKKQYKNINIDKIEVSHSLWSFNRESSLIEPALTLLRASTMIWKI